MHCLAAKASKAPALERITAVTGCGARKQSNPRRSVLYRKSLKRRSRNCCLREQREVFIAHEEIEGRSFKELSAKTGISVNTLLSRKHYAVLQLRERLQTIHDAMMDPNFYERFF